MTAIKTQSPSIVLARQPIFDRDYKVHAYELLFRASADQLSANLSGLSGDAATTRVINHAFLELGVERVIGNHHAFVNLTRNFVLSDDPMPFAQEHVVLEILEDIIVDKELIDGVKKLVSHGYSIALDDFIFHENLRPLIELASVIKVDVLNIDDDALDSHVAILNQYNVKLLAEKVETKAQFERCLELNFDYFQGYFFCRPDIIKDKPMPENQFKLLQVIEKLQDPDVELHDVEKLISQDASLSYKLLRLLNSAAMGMSRKIESIHQGLVILGLKAIKTWTTLILMSEINAVPTELINFSLIRAKMAEQLAPAYGLSPDAGFLVGLFSTMDAMLSRSMDQLVSPLPLSDEMKLALISRGGTLGHMLTNVIYYEQGQWDEVSEEYADLNVLAEMYFNATEWMLEAKQAL